MPGAHNLQLRGYVDANFASPYALVAFVSLIEKGLQFAIEPLDLAAHADPVPQRLCDYANHQWRRPSVQQWINRKRPPLVGY